MQRDQGEVERAEATLRAALKQPGQGATHRPIVVLLAALLYRRAIELSPRESGGQWFNLGWVLVQRGDTAGARNAYAQAHATDPGDLRSLFARHLSLPMIYADGDTLRASRSEFAAGLSALETELPAALQGLPEARALDGLRWTNFFLAYQGGDDRELQSRYAALAARVVDTGARDWHAPPAPRSEAARRLRT